MTLDIMMPFYGRFDHFQNSVQSVLNQTESDWRLVIVDDMCHDTEPQKWIDSLHDRRITYIRNEQNLGTSKNFIKCVENMQTEFSTILGCDDMLLPNYVAHMKKLINQFPEASIIQSGVVVIDEKGNSTRPLADRVKKIYRPKKESVAQLYQGENLVASLLRGNWAYFPSLCWRRSELQKHTFRQDLNVVQDLAILLEIIINGGTLVLDDEIVFNYRRHRASVSGKTGFDGSKFIEERTVFHEAAAVCAQLGWKKAEKVARHHISSRFHAITELPYALKAKNKSGARTLIQHILRRPYSELNGNTPKQH